MSLTQAEVLAAARSQAVKRGHGTITTSHMVVALVDLKSAAAEELFSVDVKEAAVQSLQKLPKDYSSPEPNEQVAGLIAELANDPDWERGLCERLIALVTAAEGSVLPPPSPRAESTPTTGAAPAARPREDPPAATEFTVPERFAEVGSVAQPDESLIRRQEVVDQLLASVGTLYRALPVLTADEGSGRSTVAELLATRMTEEGSPYSLPVVRVSGSRARLEPEKLHSLIAYCRGKALVVLDDLEVLLGLGGRAPDLQTMALLRSTIEDPEHRLIGIMNGRYREALGSLDQEIAEEIEWVELPDLEADQASSIARLIAQRLAVHHSVEIEGEAMDSLLRYMQAGNRSSALGDAAHKLDMAAGLARLAGRNIVTSQDLAARSARSDALTPAELRTELAQDVFGQDDAIRRVATIVAKSRDQLDVRTERPDGVFLFAGPTGTGKTELARSLARVLHGSRDSLIRLDMSEFYSEHTIANLIGSPPGYVGSDSPDGWLTTRIRRRPDSVLLLDEIEKAHPVVWNAFLQVFDAGRMTDAANGEVDFSRVTIVATTNLGSRAFAEKSALGFAPESDEAATEEKEVRETIKQVMSPELINRFDDVIVFHPLTHEAILQICRQVVGMMCERMKERGWDLTVSDEAVELIAQDGYSPEYGARELQRTADRLLLEPLMLLPKGSYRGTVEEGQVAVNAA